MLAGVEGTNEEDSKKKRNKIMQYKLWLKNVFGNNEWMIQEESDNLEYIKSVMEDVYKKYKAVFDTLGESKKGYLIITQDINL